MDRSFAPSSETVNINVSGTSQRVFVGSRNGPIGVRVVNNGTETVWIRAGDSSVTATTASGLPIGPGVHEVLTFNPAQNGELHIAAIAAGATGRIYFTQGSGV